MDVLIDRALVVRISTAFVMHVNVPYPVMDTDAHTSVPDESTRVSPAVAVPNPVPVTVRRVPPALPEDGEIVRRLGVTATVLTEE